MPVTSGMVIYRDAKNAERALRDAFYLIETYGPEHAEKARELVRWLEDAAEKNGRMRPKVDRTADGTR